MSNLNEKVAKGAVWMNLKEELEILRGEPIKVFTGDPMDIPCIETSDSEKLCKHPVVSVQMITYNHEPYIRQAIEGVMMQKTGFEFELVIGEDCSQDKTREICFEYQKRYPEKIRVLWAEVNVNKLGGNGRRTRAHCRGEFIAYCEGDDYWTDPLKLQKQVDAMRRNPSVGICFGVANITELNGTKTTPWDGSAFKPGFMKGMDFFRLNCLGRPDRKWAGSEWFIMTQTVMLRKSVLAEARRRYEVFSWKLCMGDATTWLGVSSLSDAYYIAEPLAVYRRVSTGACTANGLRVIRDAILVRFYYSVVVLGASFDEALRYWRDALMIAWINQLKALRGLRQIYLAWKIVTAPSLRSLLVRPKGLPALMLAAIGLLNRLTAFIPIRIVMKLHRNKGLSLTSA